MVFGDPNEVHDEEEWAEWLKEIGLPFMTKFEYMRDYEAEGFLLERKESRISGNEYLI